MTIRRLAIFPLSDAVLFPGMGLPLHIFEPRYRAMVQDVLVRDRQIGMIQPRPEPAADPAHAPSLYNIGCVGRIAEVEALDDGRYNLLLAGTHRFTIVRELNVTTPFRQVEADIDDERPMLEILSSVERAGLEREARAFAKRNNYLVDWDAVSKLDDQSLVNGIAQVAPFDGAAKQALLESNSLTGRAELAIQLMQFFGNGPADETRPTLQ